MDKSRRTFLGVCSSTMAAFATFFTSVPFVKSFMPSAKALAFGEPIEVDIGSLAPGEVLAKSYRGKTILIMRRTPEMIQQLSAAESRLLDAAPPSDPPYVQRDHRGMHQDYLVVEGVCTHLGCVPRKFEALGTAIVGSWWTGGFICPCHQSAFDYAGRVVKGPAQRNLPIPPHRFASATRLVVGESPPVT
jgi:ubiquinol-cytochrome c reductase iron-sulfur subunit